MCCTSLRGAAFFGASIHIAVGFLLFTRYVIATLLFTFYNFNDLFSERVSTFLAPFMVYVTLLLALGLLIFHSVEKEYFWLLKWSSVAFSLLQLAVFVTILLLKLSPSYNYHEFPFLPHSLTQGHFNSRWPPPPPGGELGGPAGPGSPRRPPSSSPTYISIPHGSTIGEKEILVKSKNAAGRAGGSRPGSAADPPDPGGGAQPPPPPSPESSPSEEEEEELSARRGLLREVQRLGILISCVLLTLVYLTFLFLYIRELNEEDTGHVFGHATAVTRNVAFYVQPQYALGQPPPLQPPNDNNKLISTTRHGLHASQGQRSQTQIPSGFLPQKRPGENHVIQNAAGEAVLFQTNNQEHLGGSSSLGSEVQRSPARQRIDPRAAPAQPNPHTEPQLTKVGDGGNPVGGLPQTHIVGEGTREAHSTSLLVNPNAGGFGPRAPHIPSQVRIGFYAPGVSGNRAPPPPEPVLGGGPRGPLFRGPPPNFAPQHGVNGSRGMMMGGGGMEAPLEYPPDSQQQQQGQFLVCSNSGGMSGGGHGQQVQGAPPPPAHQFQRLQFRKNCGGGQSSLTSDMQSDSASSSQAYSPNPPLPRGGKQQQYNISMV